MNESILMVEDDELVRCFVHEQLVLPGYRVLQAQDGPGALKIQGRSVVGASM